MFLKTLTLRPIIRICREYSRKLLIVHPLTLARPFTAKLDPHNRVGVVESVYPEA